MRKNEKEEFKIKKGKPFFDYALLQFICLLCLSRSFSAFYLLFLIPCHPCLSTPQLYPVIVSRLFVFSCLFSSSLRYQFRMPFYYEIKTIFVLWLMSPYGNGARIVYKNIVHPELNRREEVSGNVSCGVKEKMKMNA